MAGVAQRCVVEAVDRMRCNEPLLSSRQPAHAEPQQPGQPDYAQRQEVGDTSAVRGGAQRAAEDRRH